MSQRSEQKDEMRFTQGRGLVTALIGSAASGITDTRAARRQAEESLDAFKAQKDRELAQAERKFKRFQVAEFIFGALVILQMAVFLVQGEPYIWLLAASATACAVIYVAIAALDTRAKNHRQDVYFEALAARKARIKNRSTGAGVDVEFKGLGK